MKAYYLVAIYFVLINITSPAKAQQSYLHRMLDTDSSGPEYSFDLSYITEDMKVEASYKPLGRLGERLLIREPSKAELLKALDADIESLEKEVIDDFWCSSFHKRIPRDAKLLSQTKFSATYTFEPLADAGDDDDAMVMANLVGTVVVAKSSSTILKFQLKSAKHFKPTWFVKILSLELNADCVSIADGRAYVKRFEMELDGKIALKRFRDYEYREVNNVQTLKQGR